MRKFFEKYWLVMLVNIICIAIFMGLTLYTLTYTQVPVSAQHLWFGKDLHTYLVYTHIFNTVSMLIIMPVFNFVYFKAVRG